MLLAFFQYLHYNEYNISSDRNQADYAYKKKSDQQAIGRTAVMKKEIFEYGRKCNTDGEGISRKRKEK